MSCKSGIYAVNTTVGSSLAVDSIYSPNTVIRKFGDNIRLAGNGIVIKGAGYYKINAIVSVLVPTAGDVVATLYKDGVAVSGATATASTSANNDYAIIPITALIRVGCNCEDAVLTVVMSGSATTSNNLAITVEKE
jgi:hypothetical protein